MTSRLDVTAPAQARTAGSSTATGPDVERSGPRDAPDHGNAGNADEAGLRPDLSGVRVVRVGDAVGVAVAGVLGCDEAVLARA